jgi:hypothetical protein
MNFLLHPRQCANILHDNFGFFIKYNCSNETRVAHFGWRFGAMVFNLEYVVEFIKYFTHFSLLHNYMVQQNFRSNMQKYKNEQLTLMK